MLLEVPGAEVRDGARRRVALWIVAMAVPALPAGLRFPSWHTGTPSVRVGWVPLVPNPQQAGAAGLRLAPASGSVSAVRVRTDDPSPRGGAAVMGAWCVGALALLLPAPADDAGGRDRAIEPSASVRRLLESFAARLQMALDEEGTRLVGADAASDRLVVDRLAGRAVPDTHSPDDRSILGRLMAGPAHRVLLELVSDQKLVRRTTEAALRNIARGVPNPVATPLGRRATVVTSAAQPPREDQVLASMMHAVLVSTPSSGADLPFERPLIAATGERAGRVMGRLALQGVEEASTHGR